MPRLSLYRPEKTQDYKFLDRTINEMFTVGGTDLYIHKYLGPDASNPSNDFTQPQYNNLNPLNIQDLLFLENRDRKYAPDIYRLRGHYNVQNLDFDLSQFGLFLNNDIIFITVHYNTMIDLIGRKLMVGDVLELPHLTDYHPLNDTIPVGLRRYYQITDANFASEGFSQTWYPHLWRIKCEPLIDSQEFKNILDQPINKDNYLGDWDKTKTYVPGYVVTYGENNWTPLKEVPVGIPCQGETWVNTKEYPVGTTVTKDGITYVTKQLTPAGTPVTNINYYEPYWQLDAKDSLKDVISRYNKNIQINDAAIQEAKRLVPKSGYDRSQLYILPTDNKGKPAPPVNLITRTDEPELGQGSLEIIQPTGFTPSPIIRITAAALASINANMEIDDQLKTFIQLSMELAEIAPELTDSGSGSVEPDIVLAVKAFGPVNVPFGTSDNTYAFADADPDDPNFDRTLITPDMDYRADCDPRFRFIVRSSPQGFGYLDGYLVGTGEAPNGEPVTSAIEFPSNPTLGQYVLRIDYLPQQLFRWDGSLWVKISENVRTGLAFEEDDQSLFATFINNNNTTETNNGPIPEQQALSTILRITPD
jgi:hypothetical protein